MRDGRDPTEFGQLLSSLRLKYPELPMSKIADIADELMPKSTSSSASKTIGEESPKVYLEELKGRQDKHAKDRLTEIVEGVDLGDDPSG